MASSHNSVSPILQITGGTVHLADHLNRLIAAPDLKRLRMAVSYVRWSGLGLLAAKIEEFLKHRRELETIYGIGNGVTTPDSLLYSLYLQQLYSTHIYAGVIDDKYQNATFHPKFFEFKFEKKTIAIIGSGNITAGGLLTNTEIAFQVELADDHQLITVLDDAWKAFESLAHPIDIPEIRKLRDQQALGSEIDTEQDHTDDASKPFTNVIRQSLLSKLDPLTVKPKKLYLQILEYETGAQIYGGDAGYQVQLPVATLAAFFGVAPDQTQKASFHFGSDVIEVNLTHFGNKTHRVRLRPIKDIHRPAIVIFERISMNDYNCTIVPPNQYDAVLTSKCTEQTRAGARKWGLS